MGRLARSAAAAERDSARLVRALSHAHRCPPGCELCAAERGRVGVPALLSDFAGLVAGDTGLRVAYAVLRGGAFPRFTNDDVVQACIEEALLERAVFEQRHAELRATGGGDTPAATGGAPAEPTRLSELEYMQAARDFAKGKTPAAGVSG